MKVAVIGAGAVGSAAARYLSEAGHSVDLYEQFQIGHTRGSSHGSSRIIRHIYHDPYYTALMVEAFPLWHELEEKSGERLYVKTGMLAFGRESEPWLANSRRSLRENRILYEVYNHVEVARKFGGFHLDLDEIGIFEEDAGYLKSDKVIVANLRLAKDAGTNIFENTPVEIREDGVVNGKQYDAICVTAGAWTTNFAPIDLETRLQHFAYFGGVEFTDIPVFVDAAPHHIYGFPNYGKGIKIGMHEYGQIIDADNDPREPNPQTLAQITQLTQHRLGRKAEIVEAHTCLYALEENEDFRIGRIECKVPAFYVSACSGHGFKFSLWMGSLLRDLVSGERQIELYPRFYAAKGTKSSTNPVL